MREIIAADKPPRRRFHLVQHAVDAVAHDQPVLERLDVDVRGAHLQRVGDHQRDEPDHRRLGGQVLELLDVGVERELVALLDVADDLAELRLAGTVEALERGLELGGDRHHRLHLPPGDHAERVDRIRVGRVGHGKHQLVGILVDRQRARFAQEARGDLFLENRQLGIRSAVDERQTQLVRQRLGDIALRDQPQRHQQRAELLAGIRLQAQRALERGGIELAALDENFAKALSRGSVGWVHRKVAQKSRQR